MSEPRTAYTTVPSVLQQYAPHPLPLLKVSFAYASGNMPLQYCEGSGTNFSKARPGAQNKKFAREMRLHTPHPCILKSLPWRTQINDILIERPISRILQRGCRTGVILQPENWRSCITPQPFYLPEVFYRDCFTGSLSILDLERLEACSGNWEKENRHRSIKSLLIPSCHSYRRLQGSISTRRRNECARPGPRFLLPETSNVREEELKTKAVSPFSNSKSLTAT